MEELLDLLEYPFDSKTIIKKKKSIKRFLLDKQDKFIDKRIAVMGGSTTAEIKDILELFLLKEGIKPLFYESSFGRYYEEIMFENERLKSFKPEIIYIHTTVRNINRFPQISDSDIQVKALLDSEIEKIQSMWYKIENTFSCSVIQNNFELPYHRILGNFEFSDIHGKVNFIMHLNLRLSESVRKHKNIYINDINYLASDFGLSRWHDKPFWYMYKYALSYDAIPLVSHNISSIINSFFGKSRKCIVVDLDNTLWGGIIGDDGKEGIVIGKDGAVAEAYTEFQQYLKKLEERGIMLAICSKNEFGNAEEGLDHPDMVLKLEDFITHEINWNPKPENILKIAERINISLDSLVFIDDNPSERNLVKNQIDTICVPDIGNDIVNYSDIIDKSGYFEPATISKEDLDRNKYYKREQDRVEFKQRFDTYEDYLKSLSMVAEIEKFKDVYLDRITQLTNKTNQFNLTTRRYQHQEIKEISKSKHHIAIYGKLIDRFGDNGLISVLVGQIRKNTLNIELWLLSCRVFKRDMELAMFDYLVEECIRHNIDRITGFYLRTPKNNLVSDLYQSLGFDMISKKGDVESFWEFHIPKIYINKNTVIKVN